jgi:hypothetical protein
MSEAFVLSDFEDEDAAGYYFDRDSDDEVEERVAARKSMDEDSDDKDVDAEGPRACDDDDDDDDDDGGGGGGGEEEEEVFIYSFWPPAVVCHSGPPSTALAQVDHRTEIVAKLLNYAPAKPGRKSYLNVQQNAHLKGSITPEYSSSDFVFVLDKDRIGLQKKHLRRYMYNTYVSGSESVSLDHLSSSS